MGLVVNSANMEAVVVNGVSMERVIANGTEVWTSDYKIWSPTTKRISSLSVTEYAGNGGFDQDLSTNEIHARFYDTTGVAAYWGGGGAKSAETFDFTKYSILRIQGSVSVGATGDVSIAKVGYGTHLWFDHIGGGGASEYQWHIENGELSTNFASSSNIDLTFDISAVTGERNIIFGAVNNDSTTFYISNIWLK